MAVPDHATDTTSRPRQRLAGGVARVFAAEMLIIPTGIIFVMYLTRALGPGGYGLLILSSTFVDWVESTVSAAFTRATVKFVSEAHDWRPVAARALRQQLLASVAGATLLAVAAGPIAALMHEPALAGYLRLYSVEIPIFCLASVHRDILVGLGQFRQRAFGGGAHAIARLAFILLLVGAGLSINGAIITAILASGVELAVCRWYVRPAIFGPIEFPGASLLEYVKPLSLYTVFAKLFDKLDLVTYKALGATAAAAGIYSGAEGLASLPTIIATSLAPLVMSSLGESIRADDLPLAKRRAERALRAMLLLIPLAAMLPGMGNDIVATLYGTAFLPAVPLFNVMVFGSLAMFCFSVTTSIIVAAGRPGLTFAIVGPMVLAQLAGDVLVIPRWGALGASWVTTACACAGCMVAVLYVKRIWSVVPRLRTLISSSAVGAICFLIARLVPSPGVLVFVKFAVLSGGAIAAFWWLGELPGARRPTPLAAHA